MLCGCPKCERLSQFSFLRLELGYGGDCGFAGRSSAQLVANKFTDCNHLVQVDVVLNAEAVQQVHHILRGHVSCGSFSIRATTQTRH